MIISWWSAGVTSAVATKLAIDKHGKDNVLPVYFHIDTAHPDNERFIRECEEWYGRDIMITKSHKHSNQFEVIEKDKYVNGPGGARCTLVLKKRVRERIEREMEYEAQVFGFEFSKKEVNRAIRFKEQYPASKPIFPLIEKKLTKPECLYYLEAAGIERPEMYKLGYGNNNCIGCVKGGKGYWNKIRKDFPEYFDRMAAAERLVGNSCLRGVYLDELNPSSGHKQNYVMPDCGNFCEIEFSDIMHKDIELIMKQPEQLSLF